MSGKLKPVIVPLLPMREEIVFPGTTAPFFVGRQSSMDALDRAISGDREIFVVTQRDSSVENPKERDLYEIGVLGSVLQVMKLPNGTVKALFEGVHRGKLLATKLDEKEFLAQIEPVYESELDFDQDELEDKAKKVRDLFKKYVVQRKLKLDKDALKSMKELDPMSVSDKTASLLKISNEQKQELLETLNPVIRLKKVLDVLKDEMKIKKLENKLKKEASDKFSDTKKADFLQDRLRNIQKELG